ncbi:MAG TPA: glycosyltransferase, partial [Candidatus Bathyarchaeia archaeon]|nr:glycosyltransferase [Candidatus Bathyarchaeia archaeon]
MPLVKNVAPPLLVSVIIPTYNSEKTIRQCLESVKKQTYKRIETIIVDRHSVDKTLFIAQQFKTRILSVTEERSTAKNHAAKEANGDFLLFIDSDMTLMSRTIEECVNKALETKSDAIVIPLKAISRGRLGECRKIERESLSHLNELMDAPRFFSKTALLKTGGYDEKLVCGEDFDLTLRFKKMGYKIDKVDSAVFHFEGAPSMYQILSKAYYYGKTLPALMKKEPRETVSRYAGIRIESLKITGMTFKNMSFLFSFVFMKAFEYVAYFVGVSVQLFSRVIEKSGVKTLKNKLAAHKLVILCFAVLLFISTVIFRNFFSPEWPGGGDVMGFVSRAYLYGKDFRWLYLWRDHSFGFVEGINLMDFFFAILYSIFKSPSWTVKIFMYLSYLTAAFSMYLFAYRYTHKHVAAFSASLVYVLNQWLFSQLTEAHVDILFSYALAPLMFLLYDNALKTGKFRDIAFLSIGLSLFITGFHPECIIIYGFFIAVFTVFFLFFPSKNENFKTRLYRACKVILPSTLIVFLLSAFFTIPFIANIRAPYLQSSYTYYIEDSFWASYANVTDAFTLRAVEQYGYTNVVNVYTGLGLPDFPVTVFLFVIFLLAYCTLLFRRDRYTIFFAFSTLISVFLAKGPHAPFGQFFVWAWSNIPHFAVFRAASRWIMMAVFSHAFFISLLVFYLARFVEGKASAEAIGKYFKVKVKNNKSSKSRKLVVSVDFLDTFFKHARKLIRVLSILLLICILLSGFLSCFFFFSQGLQVYTPSGQYLDAYEWLASQHDDYKAVSVCRSPSEWSNPSSTESDFSSGGMLTSLGWTHDIGFESSFIHDKPMLQNGGWNTKARQLVDYLRFRLARDKLTDNLLKILGAFAYDYVVLPYYTTNNTREFFLEQKGYQIVYNQSSAVILKNDYAQHGLFATNQSMFVVGGFESLDALSKIESFNLGRTALFCAPDSVEDNALLSKMIDGTQMFCLANSDILDLAMVSLGEDAVVIHAGDYGFSSSNMTKYWVKWPSWRTIGAWVLGGEQLTTVGKNKIDIPFELNSDGSYNIFLRVGFAPSRGELSLYVDGTFAGQIRADFPLMSKLNWVNITCLNLGKGHHSITLENDGTGYNDVDAIAIVQPSQLESRMDEITRFLQNYQGRLLYLLEAENTFLNTTGDNWYWSVSPYNGYVIRSDNLGLNVAPSAKANASSESEFMEANRSNDGDFGTRWTSEKFMLPQWLELTWNTPQTLRGVHVAFENAYATDYAIQTWNGTCWINQTIVTANSELDRVHEFPTLVETNKLRIYVTGFSDFYRVSIWEFETYSAEMTSASSKLTVSREGNYMLAARVAVGPNHGTIYFKINDQIVSIPCNSSVDRFEWRDIGPFHLASGELSLGVGNVGFAELDEVLLYSLKENESYLSLNDLFASSNPNVSVNYEKI